MLNTDIPAQFLSMILQNEAGGRFEYVNEPGDNGGPTKGGVTQANLAEWVGHPVNAQDVQDMTYDTWRAIVTQNFWIRPGFYRLPLPICVLAAVFDQGILSGPGNAIKLLQRVLGVSDDGIIGPATVIACTAFLRAHTASFMQQQYCAQRIAYFNAIVAHNPSQIKWLKGWTNRARSFV